MIPSSRLSTSSSGFTLLEILTVMLVIGILATMLLPAFSYLKGRGEGIGCQSNLRSLYAAASAHVTDKGDWPQIPSTGTSKPPYARAWIRALREYGLAEQNWVCPTVQRMMKRPDLLDPKNARVDYLPTPFAPGARTPYKFSNHPWFMERGDVHGDGNLVMLASGAVKSLHQVIRDSQSGEWEPQ